MTFMQVDNVFGADTCPRNSLSLDNCCATPAKLSQGNEDRCQAMTSSTYDSDNFPVNFRAFWQGCIQAVVQIYGALKAPSAELATSRYPLLSPEASE